MKQRRQFTLAFFLVAAFACAQTIPAVKGKNLNGQEITLPNPSSNKPVLIMIGFSHKSSEDFERWNKGFKGHYLNDPRIQYFEIVELQGVPSFVNGMILHGMRREVPEAQHSHFMTVYTGEADWKRVVKFGPPDVAYLILTDGSGKVVWQTNGPFTPEKSSQLESALSALSSEAPQ